MCISVVDIASMQNCTLEVQVSLIYHKITLMTCLIYYYYYYDYYYCEKLNQACVYKFLLFRCGLFIDVYYIVAKMLLFERL